MTDDPLIFPIEKMALLVSDNSWIQASFVAGVSAVLATLFSFLVFAILQRIASKTTWDIDDRLLTIIRFPVWYTLVMLGLLASVSLLPLPTYIINFINNILWTLNIAIWLICCVRLSRVIMRKLADQEKRFLLVQHSTLPLFENSFFVLAVFTSIYLLSRTWAIDVTTWLASAGVIGIAVGFAAKDTLSNLFSGIFILADAPYKIGDYILLDNGDRGLVRNIGLRSTKLLTRDDVEITIPNSIISNSRIINQSGGPVKRFRLRISFSVAYGTEIKQVRELTIGIAKAEKLVLDKPDPRLRFRRFEASGIAFELLCWVKLPALRGRTTDSLNEAVYNAFLEAGIEIPNDKVDLYHKEMPISPDKQRPAQDAPLAQQEMAETIDKGKQQ